MVDSRGSNVARNVAFALKGLSEFVLHLADAYDEVAREYGKRPINADVVTDRNIMEE